jgi:hypothetical protein
MVAAKRNNRPASPAIPAILRSAREVVAVASNYPDSAALGDGSGRVSGSPAPGGLPTAS